MIAYLSVIVLLLGLFIYLVPWSEKTGKMTNVGLVMFATGLLAALLQLGGRSIHLP